MDDQSPSMLKPTLIGGGLFGLLGAIPFVGALNLACCALFMAGGFLAAYLYSRECAVQGIGFRAGSGALVGLVAALFYAIANSVVWRVFFPINPDDIDQAIDQFEQGGAPPEMIDIMIKVFDMLGGFLGLIIYFFVVLLLGAIFSTVGGLIGGAVFKLAPTAPSPPAASAPPAPPADPGSA